MADYAPPPQLGNASPAHLSGYIPAPQQDMSLKRVLLQQFLGSLAGHVGGLAVDKLTTPGPTPAQLKALEMEAPKWWQSTPSQKELQAQMAQKEQLGNEKERTRIAKATQQENAKSNEATAAHQGKMLDEALRVGSWTRNEKFNAENAAQNRQLDEFEKAGGFNRGLKHRDDVRLAEREATNREKGTDNTFALGRGNLDLDERRTILAEEQQKTMLPAHLQSLLAQTAGTNVGTLGAAGMVGQQRGGMPAATGDKVKDAAIRAEREAGLERTRKILEEAGYFKQTPSMAPAPLLSPGGGAKTAAATVAPAGDSSAMGQWGNLLVPGLGMMSKGFEQLPESYEKMKSELAAFMASQAVQTPQGGVSSDLFGVPSSGLRDSASIPAAKKQPVAAPTSSRLTPEMIDAANAPSIGMDPSLPGDALAMKAAQAAAVKAAALRSWLGGVKDRMGSDLQGDKQLLESFGIKF